MRTVIVAASLIFSSVTFAAARPGRPSTHWLSLIDHERNVHGVQLSRCIYKHPGSDLVLIISRYTESLHCSLKGGPVVGYRVSFSAPID
ncbi:Uncharacterized protein HZ326_13930 [Fusarium oxysporum f. sp. albedinis]|nr:Uncharacterized protein HZ326_13930 [Fusarium oxysporum f. sp. albedinis]